MKDYPFEEIETKWQKKWEKSGIYSVKEDESYPEDKRLYVLDMFPYPSGSGLHVGHPEGYTASDIYARFKRMNGYNVLHPMGFDAFGLPAENYAIQTGQHPKITTETNIKNFRKQIKRLGFSYDWNREVKTCDDKYYKWTQWIFLKLYEKGLAYESNMPINWCNSCKTGLANEEVKDMRCERCGSEVVRRPIRQWVLKITDYAERLLKDLDELDWPESIKSMQRNWIGRSEGAYIDFQTEAKENISVFTTRADTLYGVTFMVLSPEYPTISNFIKKEQRAECEAYIHSASQKSDLERTNLSKTKTGVWTGSYAINPLSGKKIPIWISDYVIMSYGSGAVMGVPAHDERDFEFAKKFGIDIIKVIDDGKNEELKEAYTGDGKHVNSDLINGLGKEESINKIIEILEKKCCGKRAVSYKLRDWIFSRQRYWGEPIPLIHCDNCGIVKDENLPLLLPEVDSYAPADDAQSPLSRAKSWLKVKCPVCGKTAKRETNTMPQWAGSCWYYLRYLDPTNDKEFVSSKKEKYWMPVDLYIGGAEHAVLHLLYARFWHKVLYDLKLVSTNEPFKRLVNQGLVTAFAYQRKNKSLVPSDMVVEKGGKYYAKDNDEELMQITAKMSKSLKNVVNPDDIIKEYGADSLRLYEMFMGPLEMSQPWNTNGLIGIWRFITRIWSIPQNSKIDKNAPMSEEDEYMLNLTVKKVTEQTENLEFNTAISQMMVYSQYLADKKIIPYKMWFDFILILSVYAPHLSEELNSLLGNKDSVILAKWPGFDDTKTTKNHVDIAVQINGKTRSVIRVEKDSDEKTLIRIAKEDEKIKKWLEDKSIVKEIAVKNRIVNLLVK